MVQGSKAVFKSEYLPDCTHYISDTHTHTHTHTYKTSPGLRNTATQYDFTINLYCPYTRCWPIKCRDALPSMPYGGLYVFVW